MSQTFITSPFDNDRISLDDQSVISQFTNDLNLQYQRDPEKFLGTWRTENYSVTRKYLLADAQNNTSLYCTSFEPINQKPMGQIVIVHGFGEHQGRYINVSDIFAKNGYKVFLYDQRGLGYSGGRRGCATIRQMHEDLESILLQMDRSLPIFIYCHAIGAAIVFSFCIINPHINLQGIISTNSYLRLSNKYTTGKKKFLSLLNQLLPDLQFNSYIDFAQHSKNNFHINKSVNDPLLWPFMSLKMAYNIMKLCDFVLPNCQKFKTPILLIHGKEDKVSSHLNSLDFYRLIQSKDKTLKIYEYGLHELHNDNEASKMAQLIISWCGKTIAKDKRIAFILKRPQEINYKKRYLLTIFLIILYLIRQFYKKLSYKIRKRQAIAKALKDWLKQLTKYIIKIVL